MNEQQQSGGGGAVIQQGGPYAYASLRAAFHTELSAIGNDPTGLGTLMGCLADMLGEIGAAAQKLADQATAQRRTA
jgi:hypothetical protein